MHPPTAAFQDAAGRQKILLALFVVLGIQSKTLLFGAELHDNPSAATQA